MKSIRQYAGLAILALLCAALNPALAASYGTGDDTATVATKEGNYGPYLVDETGMSLYLWVVDTKGEVSECYGNCAEIWPPLLTGGKPAVGGDAAAGKLGTVERKDGTTQVTYNGWPLYYYAPDDKPGDTFGHTDPSFGGDWYLLNPQGAAYGFADAGEGGKGAVEGVDLKHIGLIGKKDAEQKAETIDTATVETKAGAYGPMLTDKTGMSLYLWVVDVKGGESKCYNQCAEIWPPLLTAGKPQVGGEATTGLLGTIERKDGTTQVTYNGWPLYHYAPDTEPGDTLGHTDPSFGGPWYLMNEKGDVYGHADAGEGGKGSVKETDFEHRE